MSQGRAAILLAALTLAALLVLATFRSPVSRVWGDEGTYLAMMASLTEDGDLRFDERDLARVEAAEGGRTHLILQRTDRGVAYSKPVLFALASAPFYLAFGEVGPIVLNALALASALALAFAYLRRLGGPGAAALVLVSYAGGAVLLPYVTWRMTDSLQSSLALVALVLCCGRRRAPGAGWGFLDRLIDWRGARYLGAALLAVLVGMRLTNGVLLLVPLLAELLGAPSGSSRGRRISRSLVLGLVAAVTYGLLAGLTATISGAPNPYRAVRTSFTPETGYPAGPRAEDARPRFESELARDMTGLRPRGEPRQAAYSALYFFVGRHTGLLFYFPSALVFLLYALRRPDRVAWACFVSFVAILVFFLGWRTDNYFGGDTFVGNRYFLSIYPVVLIALPRLPGVRWLAAVWMLAALGYASAITSAARHHDSDRGSQNHAYAGIFRLLPYESTARDIVGRRDRYWAGHFVRFVDPFPRLAPRHLVLEAGRPAAELLVAHWRPLKKLRIFVATEAPEAFLEVQDYGRRRSFPVGTAQVSARHALGVAIDLATSRPWRRHRYWWDPDTLYWTRSLRLRLRIPGAGPAAAEIRYFGDPALLEDVISYQVVGEEAPWRAVAGSSSRVRFRVRNTSPLHWEPDDVVPVRAGYRMYRQGDEALVAQSGVIPLPGRVEPYQDVEVAFEVAWPEEPGEYRLEADLVLEHVVWFGDRLGKPVLEREVVVTAED